jgi:AcrR family transcriptional regulator
MTQTTNPKRQYNSTRRQTQASETRRDIIAAARKLFSAHGYSGATIDSIAQEASVSSETVYAVFRNKRNILANLINISVGGDDRPIPLLQRTGPQAVLEERDPAHLLHLFAQDITGILERVAPIFEIIRIAAKTEPDIADLLKNMLNNRFQNLTAVAKQLQSLGSLREGLDVVQATETIWVITNPEIFSLLLIDRGWTKENYVEWLSDTLVRLLLPSGN